MPDASEGRVDALDNAPDDERPVIPVLVLTGPVGVGKSSVASVVSDVLADHAIPHAAVDLDWLRWCRPSPSDDPFHTSLGLRNLRLVWEQYRRSGAERAIVIDILESPAMLAAYRAAIPGALVTVVRLHARLETIHRRLQQREVGASLVWHQNRASELSTQMERDALEDIRIDTDDKAIEDVAWEVLRETGWVSLPKPPLDVDSVDTHITAEETVELIREGRRHA